jgi:hypothetical protein
VEIYLFSLKLSPFSIEGKLYAIIFLFKIINHANGNQHFVLTEKRAIFWLGSRRAIIPAMNHGGAPPLGHELIFHLMAGGREGFPKGNNPREESGSGTRKNRPAKGLTVRKVRGA